MFDAAGFVGGVQPGEEVIEPAGCGACYVGCVWAFGLLFEDVGQGVGVAG